MVVVRKHPTGVPLRNRAHPPRRLAPAALAAATLLSSCGGGKSPTEPVTAIFVTPDRAAAGNTITFRAGPGTTATRLDLELVATQVSGLHGLGLTIAYPPRLLSFVSYRPGTFLTQGDPLPLLVVTPLPQLIGGLLIFGGRDDRVPGVSGTGVIATLVFDAVDVGAGRVDFGLGSTVSDAAGREIEGLDWIGGEISVPR